jgi:hypothetical protein
MSEHDGDQWIDISDEGDDWLVQFNTKARDSIIATRAYRYRSASETGLIVAWAYGRPPTGAHSS